MASILFAINPIVKHSSGILHLGIAGETKPQNQSNQSLPSTKIECTQLSVGMNGLMPCMASRGHSIILLAP
jgi:hypothetical protein